MRNVPSGLTRLALACCLIACEEGDGGKGAERSGSSTCKPFAACGGDITGTWMVKDVCADDVAAAFGMVIAQPQCREAVRSHMLRVSGDYTFAADGTASYARTTTIQVQLVWTPSCLTAINNGQPVNVRATCAALGDKYATDSQFEAGSCLVDGTSCNCSVTRSIERMATATYRVSGTQIVTSGGEAVEYCVSGNSLTMLERSEAGNALLTFTR